MVQRTIYTHRVHSLCQVRRNLSVSIESTHFLSVITVFSHKLTHTVKLLGYGCQKYSDCPGTFISFCIHFILCLQTKFIVDLHEKNHLVIIDVFLLFLFSLLEIIIFRVRYCILTAVVWGSMSSRTLVLMYAELINQASVLEAVMQPLQNMFSGNFMKWYIYILTILWAKSQLTISFSQHLYSTLHIDIV